MFDNVLEYVVSLVNKTRPCSEKGNTNMKQYIEWGQVRWFLQYMLLKVSNVICKPLMESTRLTLMM